MGDCQQSDLRVGFDRTLKLKFLGSQVTTDAGLLAYRELDEALGLTAMGAEVLTDSRQGSNKQHQLVPLLRQSIFSRLAADTKMSMMPSDCALILRCAMSSVGERRCPINVRLPPVRSAASRPRRSAVRVTSRR